MMNIKPGTKLYLKNALNIEKYETSVWSWCDTMTNYHIGEECIFEEYLTRGPNNGCIVRFPSDKKERVYYLFADDLSLTQIIRLEDKKDYKNACDIITL
jgi:hypothetical protein